MENFVNKIKTKDGTEYDIRDERIPEVLAENEGKVLKVEDGAIVFGDVSTGGYKYRHDIWIFPDVSSFPEEWMQKSVYKAMMAFETIILTKDKDAYTGETIKNLKDFIDITSIENLSVREFDNLYGSHGDYEEGRTFDVKVRQGGKIVKFYYRYDTSIWGSNSSHEGSYSPLAEWMYTDWVGRLHGQEAWDGEGSWSRRPQHDVILWDGGGNLDIHIEDTVTEL